MSNINLPARAKSVIKFKTEQGTQVDLEIPKGSCLINAFKHVLAYQGLEMTVKPKQ